MTARRRNGGMCAWCAGRGFELVWLTREHKRCVTCSGTGIDPDAHMGQARGRVVVLRSVSRYVRRHGPSSLEEVTR